MSGGQWGALVGFAKEVDVSADLGLATMLAYVTMGGLVAMFAVRPELWRRLWFDRVDPRPSALMRVCFGMVILVTFVDSLVPHPPLDYSIARFLFTDEGLWLTDLARKNYGGDLRRLWDPEHGFAHWYDIFEAMWGRFTVLHLRSDPPFVFALYGVLLVSVVMMIVGYRTRWATIVAFVLCEMLYRYSPVFYTGGDTVIRVFLFLGIFVRWGEAYSLDSWRRRRQAILGGADCFVALRRIPAWPIRLMMLQLACIYCATGLLKSGPTWTEGTALYYALNLDHFYRWPQTHIVTLAQYSGALPLMTYLVRWWEILFPIALVGAALGAFERDRAAGSWPQTPALRRWLGYVGFAVAWLAFAYNIGLAALHYLPEDSSISPEQRVPVVAGIVAVLPVLLVVIYSALTQYAPKIHRFVLRWVVGKRLWLGAGFALHLGIDVSMNVGTFAEVMISVYLAWLSKDELDRLWKFLYERPLAPGEGARPVRESTVARIFLAPIDRCRFRTAGAAYVVRHHPGDASVRRASLLRIWDLGGRLSFVADGGVPPESLCVVVGGDQRKLRGDRAAACLTRVFPGLLPLRFVAVVPGVGTLARAVLRQRR